MNLETIFETIMALNEKVATTPTPKKKTPTKRKTTKKKDDTEQKPTSKPKVPGSGLIGLSFLEHDVKRLTGKSLEKRTHVFNSVFMPTVKSYQNRKKIEVFGLPDEVEKLLKDNYGIYGTGIKSEGSSNKTEVFFGTVAVLSITQIRKLQNSEKWELDGDRDKFYTNGLMDTSTRNVFLEMAKKTQDEILKAYVEAYGKDYLHTAEVSEKLEIEIDIEHPTKMQYTYFNKSTALILNKKIHVLEKMPDLKTYPLTIFGKEVDTTVYLKKYLQMLTVANPLESYVVVYATWLSPANQDWNGKTFKHGGRLTAVIVKRTDLKDVKEKIDIF